MANGHQQQGPTPTTMTRTAVLVPRPTVMLRLPSAGRGPMVTRRRCSARASSAHGPGKSWNRSSPLHVRRPSARVLDHMQGSARASGIPRATAFICRLLRHKVTALHMSARHGKKEVSERVYRPPAQVIVALALQCQLHSTSSRCHATDLLVQQQTVASCFCHCALRGLQVQGCRGYGSRVPPPWQPRRSSPTSSHTRRKRSGCVFPSSCSCRHSAGVQSLDSSIRSSSRVCQALKGAYAA